MNRLALVGGEEESPIVLLEEIASLVNRYRQERIEQLPANYQEDSTSVWISREKITEFFASNSNATGVRIYFGVVDDPFVAQGIHNLVLIPTIGRTDQTGNNDYALITKNFESYAMGPMDALICPPPVLSCTGRAFG